MATGKYLGWVDSDDALAPNALERTVAALDTNPNVGMVYTQHEVIDETGLVLGLGERCPNSPLPHHAVYAPCPSSRKPQQTHRARAAQNQIRTFSGAEGIRTPDFRIANAALSQLSYDPNEGAGN